MLRARCLCVIGVVMLLALSGATAAQAGIVGQVDCKQQPTLPGCTASVKVTRSKTSPASKSVSQCHNIYGTAVPCYLPGKGWYSGGCYWRTPPASTLQGVGAPPAGQQWYGGLCGDPILGFATEFLFIRPFTVGPGPQVLAQQAVSKLRLPSPVLGMSPGPTAVQVVHVPTWLWIPAGSWRPLTATASAGGATVTATARPVSVVWSTGDGARVTCRGPGTAWTSAQDAAAASPTCGHTYTQASVVAGVDAAAGSPAVGSFTVRATVTWKVTWVGAGTAGTEAPLTTTATSAVRVVEAVAVNTTGGDQ